MNDTIFFNAFHAPIGAHSSFTLGCLGKRGGLGLELGKPADQNVYIGLETRKGGQFEALPFFEGCEDESARYDPAHAKEGTPREELLRPYALPDISRDFRLATDTFAAGDLTLTIFSPVRSAPEPGKADIAELKLAYLPAVLAELTIDNRKGRTSRRAFFGHDGSGTCSDGMRWWRSKTMRGIAQGASTAIFTDDLRVRTAQSFSMAKLLTEPTEANWTFGLANTGALVMDVPARKCITVRFAICFYRSGIVTTGMPARYGYTQWFESIESVGEFALKQFPELRKRARNDNRLVDGRRKLNPHQRFQMIHALRSYYGSTQLLDHDGAPFWVVNEGEYRMMNTFDLTADHVFYEMRMNPWVVRNTLDMFAKRYSYIDKVHFPGGTNEHPGGISFTHDMGVRNNMARPGHSSYELYNLTGCFSHMTHEQLTNWVLCAALYAHGSGDEAWLDTNLPIFAKCLRSLVQRDHPKDSERNGVMGLDSSRTHGGAEITTYDSLDTSLGQARNNIYLAVKDWAAYLALQRIFEENHLESRAQQAAKQATRVAATVANALTEEGFIPAVLGEDCTSRLIPAVEGLVFPHLLGMSAALKRTGPYGTLIKALTTHIQTILKPGVCLYPDGGWKLSSSADNSWLSKIYICQFVVRRILGIHSPEACARADAAHHAWLLSPGGVYWAWSDQMSSGEPHGSKYYPRGVTSILWTLE